eukprot:gnl/Chilomastix_caulleri/5175.p2 GENE.gnl/Chilomastix_caulleri/5175~~gnl/Chilomastix_caulleri/5175.p2  ORF type:complete len:55 (+),score=9.47 gnl/Chilomastix_caulleri/5175:110-274(+)
MHHYFRPFSDIDFTIPNNVTATRLDKSFLFQGENSNDRVFIQTNASSVDPVMCL